MSSIYNNPKKVANLIGAEYPIDNIYTLRSEFSNVFSYVYVHRYVENNYVYKGRPIGHWLGSDGDVFDIQVEKAIDDDFSIYAGFRRVRYGAIDICEAYDNPYAKKWYADDIQTTEYLLKSGLNKVYNENLSIKVDTEMGKGYSDTEENIFRIDLGLELNL